MYKNTHNCIKIYIHEYKQYLYMYPMAAGPTRHRAYVYIAWETLYTRKLLKNIMGMDDMYVGRLV